MLQFRCFLEYKCQDTLHKFYEQTLLVDFMVLPCKRELVLNLQKARLPCGVALVEESLAVIYRVVEDALSVGRCSVDCGVCNMQA